MNGTYLLILRLDEALSGLQIGRLGCFAFASGFYLYVGSAYGGGGLPARLNYHRQRIKVHPHWHVDYLRPHTALVEIWSASCTPRMECVWARALLHMPGLSVPVRHFGASDSNCPSHMLYGSRKPALGLLTSTLLCSMLDVTRQNITLEVISCEDES